MYSLLIPLIFKKILYSTSKGLYNNKPSFKKNKPPFKKNEVTQKCNLQHILPKKNIYINGRNKIKLEKPINSLKYLKAKITQRK